MILSIMTSTLYLYSKKPEPVSSGIHRAAAIDFLKYISSTIFLHTFTRARVENSLINLIITPTETTALTITNEDTQNSIETNKRKAVLEDILRSKVTTQLFTRLLIYPNVTLDLDQGKRNCYNRIRSPLSPR